MTVSISFTSCLLAFLSRGRVRIGAGKIDGRENNSAVFFSKPVDLDWREVPHRHQTLRNLDTARELNLAEVELTSEITLSSEEALLGKTFVEKETGGKDYAIGFHPGAGKPPNRWPADRFASVANELSSIFRARIFVTSGPMDSEPVQEMLNGLDEPPVVIDNRPAREVAAALSCMRLVISNDTGIMHVAAAVGTPVLSLFGPTDPHQWAPVGKQHRYLFRNSDIRAISTEDVLKNAMEMLGGKGLV
jgi:ADP-heptose:LPS heptosyltransferase